MKLSAENRMEQEIFSIVSFTQAFPCKYNGGLVLDAIASLVVGYVSVSVRCHQFSHDHLSKVDKMSALIS